MMKRLTAFMVAVVMGSAPVAFGQTAAVQVNPNTGTVVSPATLTLENDASIDATLLTLRTGYTSSASAPLLRIENTDSGFLGNAIEVANDVGDKFWVENTGATFATTYMLSGDIDTGMRTGGADVLDLVTGNTTRMSVGSSAVALGTNISLGFSGTGAGTTLTNLGFSAFGKTLIDDADATQGRNTLGATAGVWPVSAGGTGVTALPKFHAYKSVDQALTGGATAKVTFDTEEYDTGNNFASSTFTVPSTGYWLFGAAVYSDTATITAVYLYKNGAQVKRLALDHNGAGAIITGTAPISVAATDTIEIYVNSANNANLIGASTITYFWGQLVP